MRYDRHDTRPTAAQQPRRRRSFWRDEAFAGLRELLALALFALLFCVGAYHYVTAFADDLPPCVVCQ
jgi:hypothetical protein